MSPLRHTINLLLATFIFVTFFTASDTQAHFANGLLTRRAQSLHKRETKVKVIENRLIRRQADTTNAPQGAKAVNFQLSQGSLFAFQSKSPAQQSDVTSVVIVQHGVDRNAGDYFTSMNTAYKSARQKNLTFAGPNVLIVAPLFFDTAVDSSEMSPTSLGWDDDNDWAMGSGSISPEGTDMSSLTVYDELVQIFSDRTSFPNVKQITFAGHGGGALIIQRYATLRNTADNNSPKIRYVVGNPSTMLYFTADRPDPITEQQCDVFNTFYYGLDGYQIPYNAEIDNPSNLFKGYASRNVRYLVSTDDTSSTDGDQTCGARAMGGPARKNRSLAYWKYIHLLAEGATQQTFNKYSAFPGTFASLKQQSSNYNDFKTNNFQHQLSQISGIGHSAAAVFASDAGLKAVFGK